MKNTLQLNNNRAVRYLTVLLMAGGSWLTACTPPNRLRWITPFMWTRSSEPADTDILSRDRLFRGVWYNLVRIPVSMIGIPVPVIIITIRLSMVFLITV